MITVILIREVDQKKVEREVAGNGEEDEEKRTDLDVFLTFYWFASIDGFFCILDFVCIMTNQQTITIV